VKGLLRRGVYAWEAFRRRHVTDLVLAMGQAGVDWYIKSGYPPHKVFPFCYVVETPEFAKSSVQNNQVRFMFVGSLLRLKGVDLLLGALAQSAVSRPEWQLDIIGDGPERPALQRQAEASGIGERVHFHGSLRMSEVARELARADLLVLPSRKDGWGAVVNEALLRASLSSARIGAGRPTLSARPGWAPCSAGNQPLLCIRH